MGEIVCLHCEQEEVLSPLKLGSVMPLLEFLHNLPQECNEDRELTWGEDEHACFILVTLPLPEDTPRLHSYVLHFADPKYRRSRTLGVWYAIARAVARLIQDGD